MRRRTLIQGVGLASIFGIGAVGASMEATATSADLNFDVNGVSVSLPDGDVDRITMRPRVQVEWQNYDQPVEAVEFMLFVEAPEVGRKQVFERTEETNQTSGHVEFAPGTVPLFEGGETDSFDSRQDGRVTETPVEVTAIVEFHGVDEGPNEITDRDTFEVVVRNESAHASGSGGASTNAEG